MVKIVFLLLMLSSVALSQNFWEQTNGPSGAPMLHLAVSPSNYIFAGGPHGSVSYHSGIFCSSNNGNYWYLKGLAGVSVNAITFNFNNELLVGTSAGVYRSTDEGNTWVHFIFNHEVYSLATNTSGFIFAGTDGGTYRSTDDGENWTQINNGLPAGFIGISMVVTSNNYIYEVGKKPVYPNWEFGAYRSSDNGDNWTSINAGFPNSYPNSLVFNSDGYVFAGTLAGVFRVSDSGNFWYQVNNGLGSTSVNSLALSSNGNIVAGTEGGVFRSTNSGNSWFSITNDLPVIAVKNLTVDSSNYIYAGTMNGIYITENDGTNWSMANQGISISDVRCVAVNPDGNLFCGTAGGGIYYSTDVGDNWIGVNHGTQPGFLQAIAINAQGEIFIGGYGVYRSTDNGANWFQTSLNNQYILSLAINSSGNIFASAYKTIFRSIDNGENWMEVSNGFTDDDIGVLKIDSNGYIYAGTRGSGAFRSTDNGDTWVAINNGLTSNEVNAFAVSMSGEVFAGGWNYVFRSTNNGDDWQLTNFDEPYVSALAVDSTGAIYVAAGGSGIFYSTDEGITWDDFNEGLTFNMVTTLIISDDYFFTGAVYGSVYKRLRHPITGVAERNVPLSSYYISQNYPNPFNPNTTIRYSVAAVHLVTLKVYDIIGREISTLVNEEKPAGTYEVKFDGSELPSGVYFYQLRTGSFIETKKMILLK